MGGSERISLPDLLDAMKHSAEALRTAGIPFALCGGLAVYARGGTASDHDVDFLIAEEDAERCLEALTADELSLAAIRVPVVSGTELLIHRLLTLTPQECNMANGLLMVRAIREQIDFDQVRAETKASPYARAFLVLAEELNLIGTGAGHG